MPVRSTTSTSSTSIDTQRSNSPLARPSHRVWTCPSRRCYSSPRSTRDIYRNRWHYRLCHAVRSLIQEIDEAANEVYGKSEEEDEVASSATIAPRRHDHEADTSTGATNSEKEWRMGGRRRLDPRKVIAPPFL
jgi:hypothetical protein